MTTKKNKEAVKPIAFSKGVDVSTTRLYKAALEVPASSVNDPYNGLQKQMFEDAFNSDHTVKQAILRKSQFTLGRKYDIELQVVDKGLDDDAKQKLLDDKEWKDYLNKVRMIDERLQFYHVLKAMVIQSAVFGRAACHIIYGSQTFPDGTTVSGLPVSIHILTSKFLNKVFIDPKTWEFKGVIYTQSMGSTANEKNMLKPDEIIYFTKNDYHITPRTLFYGRSDIEAVAHISETQRRMDEVDIKELMTQMWAGMLVMTINSRNQSQINALVDNLDPGKTIATNQDVKFEALEIPKDLPGLVEIRDSNDLAILRGLNVPSIVMNFENITNRATADDVLLAWQKSTLEDDRTWLKETVQPQWYDKLLSKLSGVPVDEMPMKIKMKFDTITISDWADVADSSLKLWYAGVINMEKLLTLLGMQDVIVELKKHSWDRLKEFYVPPTPQPTSPVIKGDMVNPKDQQGQQPSPPKPSKASNPA